MFICYIEERKEKKGKERKRKERKEKKRERGEGKRNIISKVVVSVRKKGEELK